MYFSAGETKDGQYSWWLYGDNHETAAWAGERFPTLYNAERAAKSFKAGAATANFEVYLDSGGKYRCRASRSSDKVAASGESFDSKYNAERAAENVRKNAGGATGP